MNDATMIASLIAPVPVSLAIVVLGRFASSCSVVVPRRGRRLMTEDDEPNRQ